MDGQASRKAARSKSSWVAFGFFEERRVGTKMELRCCWVLATSRVLGREVKEVEASEKVMVPGLWAMRAVRLRSTGLTGQGVVRLVACAMALPFIGK